MRLPKTTTAQTPEALETLARGYAENFVDRTDGIWDQAEMRDYFVDRLVYHFLNFYEVAENGDPDEPPSLSSEGRTGEMDNRLYFHPWTAYGPPAWPNVWFTPTGRPILCGLDRDQRWVIRWYPTYPRP